MGHRRASGGRFRETCGAATVLRVEATTILFVHNRVAALAFVVAVSLVSGCGVGSSDVRATGSSGGAAERADDVRVPDHGDEAAEPNGEPGVDAGDVARTVAVVGDSLTVSASEQIEASLERVGFDVLTIDAVESRRMVQGSRSLPPGIDAIHSIQSLVTPDLWVIALGTNDVASHDAGFPIGDDVTTILDALPPDAPVVWVNLWIRDRLDDIEVANRDLDRLVGARPNADVVDWFAWGDKDGVITADGVHLTERGQRLFASTILAGVRSVAHLDAPVDDG